MKWRSFRKRCSLWGCCCLLIISAGSLAEPAKKVRLATLEWPPYISEKVLSNGYVYQLVVMALEAKGYDVEVDFLPWARALKMTESGDYDALFPEYFSEDRLATMVFSDPFPGGPVGLYKRKISDIRYLYDPRKDQRKALETLKDKTVGVVRGYVNTQAFDQASFLKKYEVVDDEQNIRMLQRGRLDLIFIDQFVAEYLLKTQFPHFKHELEFLNPPLEVKSLYVAFSKRGRDMETKLKDFNAGLKLLKENGAMDQIYGDFGFGPANP